tara:strand:- start:253 stop:1131 length:879 start_codon:yes stop_codon:yes gene_type:complete
MVKIQITIEEPNDEWKNLLKIAKKDKTIWTYLIQREDAEISSMTKSVPTQAKQKKTDKSHEKREQKKREEKIAEDAKQETIKQIFESSASLEEVTKKVSEAKIKKFKRPAQESYNSKNGYNLPKRTPKWVCDDDTVERVSREIFAYYVLNYNFEINRWTNKPASLTRGTSMWPGLIKATATGIYQIHGEGKPYDKNELKARIVEKICNILDPNKNPQRGDINDEIFYSNENGHDKHVYSEEWAKYVLLKEVITKNQEHEALVLLLTDNKEAKSLNDLAKKHLGVSWLTGKPV